MAILLRCVAAGAELLRGAFFTVEGAGMTIEELIAALERADAPSRELELRIARDVLDSKPLGHAAGLPDELLVAQAEFGPWPRYTSSIDAALSLVPEGYVWRMQAPAPQPTGKWAAEIFTQPMWSSFRDGTHATHPAIALCIAALKARAAT